MFTYTVYPTPLDAQVTLTPDGSGVPAVGERGVDHIGNPCQHVRLPRETPTGHGAWLEVAAPGYTPLHLHGRLDVSAGQAWMGFDIFVLTAEPEPAPTPPPSTRTPEEIMAGIPANLTTVDGCGQYTEDAGKALHDEHGPAWGHIRKTPAQHQWNGHAVDALMLLYPCKGVQPGVYDIVQNSSSPEASKSFNWVGPPDPALWYYPPMDPVAQALRHIEQLLVRMAVALEAFTR
jgi:hypothetical protein